MRGRSGAGKEGWRRCEGISVVRVRLSTITSCAMPHNLIIQLVNDRVGDDDGILGSRLHGASVCRAV